MDSGGTRQTIAGTQGSLEAKARNQKFVAYTLQIADNSFQRRIIATDQEESRPREADQGIDGHSEESRKEDAGRIRIRIRRNEEENRRRIEGHQEIEKRALEGPLPITATTPNFQIGRLSCTGARFFVTSPLTVDRVHACAYW
jgi:hypothetical protein